jgi:alpha-tubulin suppressor-like RCC1 family protein
MPINTTQFQNVFQQFANTIITSANTVTQLQQFDTAVDTINNRISFVTYPSFASLPSPNLWPGTLVYTLNENLLYTSNGSAWLSISQPPAPTITDYPGANSTTTIASANQALNLNNLVSTAFTLAEQQSGASLYSWGSGYGGNLGLGDTNNYSTPMLVGAVNNWKTASIGSNSAAIKTDGTLWTWGNGLNWTLGLGSTTNVSTPVQVGTLADWSSISCSYQVVGAIKNNGTLWMWGLNSGGQLGQGATSGVVSTPIQVGTLTNWKQIYCGYVNIGSTNFYNIAVKTDGTLWAWGQNSFYGYLGLGNTTSYSSPVQVGSLTNWKQVSCGYTVAATKSDGTLWAWGRHYVGDATATNYSSPVQVGTATNWAYVQTGGSSNGTNWWMGIKTDGSLWACGYNQTYQLGLGNTSPVSTPVQVGTLNNWKSVYCSSQTQYNYTFAIKTDGTLWAWGYNNSGDLGNGVYPIGQTSTPTQIGTLTNWKQAVPCTPGRGTVSYSLGLTYPVSAGTFLPTLGTASGTY